MLTSDNTIPSKFENILGFDVRSLAIFRIGLASIIISDFLLRFRDIQTYYSDRGILPRTDLINNFPSPWYWSLNLLSGETLIQQLLFCFILFFAFLLLIGYRTKLASIICWIGIVSLHNRQPDLVFIGDDLLRTIAFWSMFLQLGAVYSFDSALNTSTKPVPKIVASGATVGLMLQLSWIYLPLNWLGALLLFIPPKNSFFKIIAIIFFIGAHFRFGLFFNTGIFTVAYLVVCLAMIPTVVWEFLHRKTYNKAIAGLTIYYDKDCGFCKKVVYLLRTFLILPGVSLLEAQNIPSACEDMQKYNSWVIEDYRGRKCVKWHGIAYVVSISPVLWWLAPILRIKPLMAMGNKIYKAIATNRSVMGHFTNPFLFRAIVTNNSKLFQAVTCSILILVTTANYHTAIAINSPIKGNLIERKLELVEQFLRLDKLPVAVNLKQDSPQIPPFENK